MRHLLKLYFWLSVFHVNNKKMVLQENDIIDLLWGFPLPHGFRT